MIYALLTIGLVWLAAPRFGAFLCGAALALFGAGVLPIVGDHYMLTDHHADLGPVHLVFDIGVHIAGLSIAYHAWSNR